MAGAAAWVFGPGVGNPIKQRLPDIPVAASMDFRNWQVNGLSMQLRDPHRSVSLAFRSDRVSVDYHFDAIHPVYA